MRDNYDISKLKVRKNAPKRHAKIQIAIRLDPEVINYFKDVSDEYEIPYQSLINLYLKDCVNNNKRPLTKWIKKSDKKAS